MNNTRTNIIQKAVLRVVLVLFTCPVLAQSFINNGALVTIKSNTTITLGDSVVNNGEVTNNGTIILTGSWTNNGTYNPEEGTVVLGGQLPQRFDHNDQSLTGLTVRGGGDKFFSENIHVVDELLLENGRLVSQDGARIIVEPGGIITGASTLSYIIGEVVQKGEGDKMFPVGVETAYLPVELMEVTGSNVELGVSAREQTNTTSVVGTLDDVSSLWYWELNTLQGQFEGAFVKLSIFDEQLSGNIDQVVVAEAATLEEAFHSLGQKDFTGDLFSGEVTSSLKGTGAILTIGFDASVTEELPEINIFNAVSPNGDNLHDFLKIENIEAYPGNKVIIYDKQGNLVFETHGYNNVNNAFFGESNTNQFGILPSGTYYYWVDRGDGSNATSGFFVLNR